MAITATISMTPGGVAQVSKAVTVADVAGSLNSTFFLFSAIDSVTLAQKNYYVWYNINSAGVDPAVSGATGIAVAGATGVTANTLATATRSAITSGAGTNVTVSGATNNVIITDNFVGNVTVAADGSAATGFTITTPTAGIFSSVYVNQPMLATVVVSNSGGSAVTVKSVTPSAIVTSGTVPNIPACALGLPNFLPGQNITVGASGTASFQFNVVFFAPSSTAFGDPAGTYSVSCLVATSDGSITAPTAAAIVSVSAPTVGTNQ